MNDAFSALPSLLCFVEIAFNAFDTAVANYEKYGPNLTTKVFRSLYLWRKFFNQLNITLKL